MLGPLRRRVRAWFEARTPRSDRWLLTQRNVYIVPTRAGWAFVGTLLVMLMAAVNYQLNLGFALTFLLGGAGLVAMHQTHGNLRGLNLHLKPPQPVFAGEAATLELVLDNPGHARHGVGLGLAEGGWAGLAFCDVPAGGSTVLRLAHQAPRRGLHRLPTLLVETRFPLGLFRAWTVWRPAAQQLVWPAPEQPARPLPPAPGGLGGELPVQRGSGSEFDGVRAWRRGDALRQVVWKKVARSGELVSRDTAASAASTLVLDFSACGATEPEARLARLTTWVLAAERGGRSYVLRLPGQELPAASGDGQRQAALRALALWGHGP